MATPAISDEQLLAYLDETLPLDQMAPIESELRRSESLRNRAAGLLRHRDDGMHSVGEIWRRMRLSCPSRSELGGFVLGTLDRALMEYVDFHLRTVGCRYCAANLEDLEHAGTSTNDAPQRRQKFFQSSAGYLRRDE